MSANDNSPPLPPLPDAPAGHAWVYRGTRWSNDGKPCVSKVLKSGYWVWERTGDPEQVPLAQDAHYAELVPTAPVGSGTPRTDAAKFTIRFDPNSVIYKVSIPRYNGGDVVPAEVAADLERETARLQALATTLKADLAALRAIVSDLLEITDHELGDFSEEDGPCTAGDNMCGDLCGHHLCNSIGCVRAKLRDAWKLKNPPAPANPSETTI